MYHNFAQNIKRNKSALGLALTSSNDGETPTTSKKLNLIRLSDHIAPTNIESPIDGIQAAYYINIDSSTERRLHMEAILSDPMFRKANCNVFRIPAIDGRDSRFRVEDHFVFYGGTQQNPRMMPTEYACTLSHIKAIHQFARDVEENNWDYDSMALIAEDDLSLEFVHFWPKSVRDLVNAAVECGSLPEDWEVLQLSYCLFAPVPSGKYAEPWHISKNYCGTIAYLIRYPAAVRLVQYLCQFSNPSDPNQKYYIGGEHPYYHHSDRFLFSFFRTYTSNPPLMTYRDSNDSTIHMDHVDYHAKSKERTKRMWLGWDASESSVP